MKKFQLLYILVFTIGCQADLKVKTKQVAVNCDKNPLHPNCQEQMITSSAEGESENLPSEIKAIALANEAEDGWVNLTEKSSTAPAFIYTAPQPQIKAAFTDWLVKSAECTKDLEYPNTTVPSIHLIPEADGEYYACVKMEDIEKKRSMYGRTPLVHLDATPPVVANIPTLSLGKVTMVKAKATDNNPLT